MKTLTAALAFAILATAVPPPSPARAGSVSIATSTEPQGSPAVAFDFGGSPSATGATPPRYLVAYDEATGGLKRQIRGRLLRWDGVALGSALSISDAPGLAPAVNSTRPTVAFKFGRLDAPKRNHLVAWQRDDGRLGYRIVDKDGGALLAAQTISGAGTLKDVTAAASPAGGWAAGACGATYGCNPYHLVYRSSKLTTAGRLWALMLTLVSDVDGRVLSTTSLESFGTADDAISLPHIGYGHSTRADYFVVAYRRPATGEIVARTVGGPASTLVLASTSTGAPVVSYSHAANRWAVVWRDATGGFRPSVRLRGQILDGATFALVGGAFTIVSAAGTSADLLSSYSAAGSHTAVEYSPYQGVFDVAHTRKVVGDLGVSTYQVSTTKVFTGGAIGTTSTLFADGRASLAVKMASTRIDPIPSSPLAPVATCTGAASSRCALWAWQFAYSSSDPDIYGYSTTAEY